MKVIAIIPARGGSKGIPKKNIKILSGEPLIAYTIKDALKSDKISRVIVSTDDDEVSKISREYGSEVIKRPKNLARDDSSVIEAIFHVINELQIKNDKNSIIILLQPTSPLRTVEDINNSIDIYMNSEPCQSVISVFETTHPPFWSLKIINGYLKPLFGIEMYERRRQDFEKVYIPNGAIYLINIDTLIKFKTFNCKYTVPYIMPKEKSIDIDDEIDFMLAELLMEKLGWEK